MNIKTNRAPGEIGSWAVLSWIIIAFAAYWCLPWTALEYGITDFTLDELLDALGWQHNKTTLVLPLALILLVPFAWIKLSGKKSGWLFTVASGLAIGLIVALFQALTTIQEMTLTFVPKILVIFLAIVVFLPYMMTTVIEFGRGLFDRITVLG